MASSERTVASGALRVLRVIARMNVGGPALQVTALTTQLDPDRYELSTGATRTSYTTPATG